MCIITDEKRSGWMDAGRSIQFSQHISNRFCEERKNEEKCNIH